MIDIFGTFLEPLVTGPLSLAAGWFAQRLKVKYIDRRTLRGVFSFSAEDTHVFLPLRSGKKNSGVASGYGDLLALSEFMIVTEALYNTRAQVYVHPSQSDFSSYSQENVVIIGGGKYNLAYLHFIEKLNPPLHFWDTETMSNDNIRNRQSTNIFCPKRDAAGNVVYDIGLVLRAPNPYNENKTILIAAGSHSYGSAAAMRYLCDPRNGSEIISRHRKRAHFVVGCDVSNHTLGQVKRISNIEEW
jgi:hypothetical protein